MWFGHVEAILKSRKITPLVTKFSYVMGTHNQKVATEKDTLIDRFFRTLAATTISTPSNGGIRSQKSFSTTASKHQLVDRISIDDNILKTFKIPRLPTAALTVVSTSTSNLEDLATLAEKVT
ncbi:unnamed protein product [Lepeophtheirus salmonis]|uniref:(salmon louse) hypothetical protein n=1 Tax=Lepeophtheirus salmonis TaxID=72036 RepID=A0A7R8HAS1_LEPSM|nr:unnamed protein product [Lepeophtheirus salmonis]CAF2960952.1 unnamed protein product [Lepeophtheirus salmonis]